MKKLARRLGDWNLGFLPFATVARIFVGVLVLVFAVVGGLVVVDFALYLLGHFFPLDVMVWGTYAAWASAILPTLGITVSAATWMAGRHAESLQAAEEAALKVVVERRSDAVTSLVNNSDWPLVIVSSDPVYQKHDSKVVRPKDPRVLFAEDTEQVSIRIRGYSFTLGTSGTMRRVQ